MNKFRFLLFLCVALIWVTSTSAQAESDVFVSGAGRFAIEVSGKPTERKELHYSLSNFFLDGESIVWKDSENNYVEVQYAWAYGDNPKLSGSDRAKIIAAYKKPFLDELKSVNAMTSETEFVFEGLPGLEIRAVAAKYLLTRLFFTKYRFIALSITKPAEIGFAQLTKVADSFRFLTKAEYSAALISENTPTPLPQISAKRPVSDAMEDGLKGKVRTVISDSQEKPGSPRESDAEESYDENGNLTKSIYFHNGFPSIIKQWGWIDNMRVSDEGFIQYGSDEGPNEIQITEIMASPLSPPDTTSTSVEKKKRDDRYKDRYEYKYDDAGRLSEKTIYGNDGVVRTRTVFTYNKERREEVIYDERGAVSTRSVEILDASGNVVEERRYDHRRKFDGATVYKYEFDPRGNWMVSKSFEKRIVKGRTIFKPGYVTYRKISYY